MISITQLGETMRTIMQTRAQEIGQQHEAFKPQYLQFDLINLALRLLSAAVAEAPSRHQ